MPRDMMKERGRALEDAFFRKEADSYRERLRVREDERAAREEISDASGIADEDVVERLASLGVRADTLAALTLIPLVEVAWADGKMEDKEREAVLSGAESTGIHVDSSSYGLLRIWLEDRPAPDLYLAWREYIAAVCSELSVESRLRLQENIVGRARAVAESAGGFLGLGSTSSDEERVLQELDESFGV